jgi:hypothetical protein
LFFSVALVAIVLVSSWPLFSGLAIRGENVPGKFYDRIVEIPQDQKSLSSYINQHALEGLYTLPHPGSDYGSFALENDDILIGQDLLSKQINQPFIYTSTSGGISKAALKRFNTCINNSDIQCLSDFPIQFILFRKDLPDSNGYLREWLSQKLKPVYVNPTYALYEMSPTTLTISPKEISYRKLSPTNYQFSINAETQNQELIFRQNYSAHWRLIESNTACEIAESSLPNLVCELKRWVSNVKKVVLNEFQFEGTHHECIYYANCWNISASGQSRLSQYTIIYFPQVYYQVCGLISLLVISILGIFAFRPSKVDQ